METDKRIVLDKVFTAIIVMLAILALTPLIWIVSSVVINGVKAIVKAGIDILFKPPASPLSQSLGGVGPALIGTLILMALTTAIGMPIAFFTAVLATEYPHTILAKAVNIVIRTLLEVPTVLIGMFVYSLVVVPMGRFSAIAGAIALAIVLLPYTYTYIESALSSIPREYREAAFSIGLTRIRALMKVFVGIARRGILAGMLIGLAKACGETAPLLFTIGGSTRVYFTGIDQPIDAIPLLIYRYALTPYENYHALSWAAALILISIYLPIFVLAKVLVREVEM